MKTHPIHFVPALCVTLLAALATAFGGSPDFRDILPRGGQIGTEVNVTLTGNYLDDAQEIEDIEDAKLTAQWVPVLWAHCSECQKWRLMPPTVFLTKKKRGEKFTCNTVHPKGCAEPLKGDESKWAVDSS